MNKTVVFDLDGTLADTAATIAEAMNRVIEEKGAERIPNDRIITFVGNGVGVLVEKAYAYRGIPCSLEDEAEAIVRFHEFYSENHTDAEAYPGMIKVVRSLYESGVTLGVYSNKPNRFVKPIVDKIFGENVFAFAVGQTERPRKPDSTVLLELIEAVGSTPECTVYVGDSEVDVKTALNANTMLSAVSWGYRSAETLKEAGAAFITDDADELLDDIKTKLGI